MHWQISNTEGELYCLSVRSPYFKWIQDFSSLDKYFTVTPGNNGRLYVTVPVRALVLALDALSGTILWQRSIGPLSTTECAPVVDSNGNYMFPNTCSWYMLNSTINLSSHTDWNLEVGVFGSLN
jgi:outer membrane protein assembly factor BamB